MSWGNPTKSEYGAMYTAFGGYPEPPPCYAPRSQRRRTGVCEECGAGKYDICNLLPDGWVEQ